MANSRGNYSRTIVGLTALSLGLFHGCSTKESSEIPRSWRDTLAKTGARAYAEAEATPLYDIRDLDTLVATSDAVVEVVGGTQDPVQIPNSESGTPGFEALPRALVYEVLTKKVLWTREGVLPQSKFFVSNGTLFLPAERRIDLLENVPPILIGSRYILFLKSQTTAVPAFALVDVAGQVELGASPVRLSGTTLLSERYSAASVGDFQRDLAASIGRARTGAATAAPKPWDGGFTLPAYAMPELLGSVSAEDGSTWHLVAAWTDEGACYTVTRDPEAKPTLCYLWSQLPEDELTSVVSGNGTVMVGIARGSRSNQPAEIGERDIDPIASIETAAGPVSVYLAPLDPADAQEPRLSPVPALD